MKYCTGCKQTKQLNTFGKDKYSSTGYTDRCKLCRNKAARERAILNPNVYKKRNENSKEYRKKYYDDPVNKLRYRDLNLKKSFGIGLTEYNELFQRQNGLCSICFQPERTKRNVSLAVDHNHQTGQIRGLLCSHCNRALGLFNDSLIVLKNAIQYLEKK